MSWDRIEPPCLFCMLTPWKLVLCSHPNLARSKKASEISKALYKIFRHEFGLALLRVYGVSIEWKWNRSIFMTSISTVEILMAFPYFVPTFLYRGFSIHSKPSSRKEFWKKKLKIQRKEREGSFITAPLIFLRVLFQIDVDVDIMKPVVWKWYAPPQNAVFIFVVVFYPRW